MNEVIISNISPLEKTGGGFCARCRCRCSPCDCDRGVCTKCSCASVLPEDAFSWFTVAFGASDSILLD